jgi:hypothetical protein
MLPGNLANSMGMYGASAVRPPSTGMASPATSVGGPNNPGAAFSGVGGQVGGGAGFMGGGAGAQSAGGGQISGLSATQMPHGGVGQLVPQMHASGLPNEPPAGIHPELWQSVLQHLGQTNFGRALRPQLGGPSPSPQLGNINTGHAWGGPIAGPGAMY